jgi:hypothetical protein
MLAIPVLWIPAKEKKGGEVIVTRMDLAKKGESHPFFDC